MSYEKSRLDIHRIKQYAQRVARETKKLPVSGMDLEWHRSKATIYKTVEVKQFFGLLTSERKIPEHVNINEVTLKIGPHWELHRRNYHVETKESDDAKYLFWVLLADGQLKLVSRNETYFRLQKNLDPPQIVGAIRDMTAEDILQLDHKPKQFHYESKSERRYGNTADGPLIVHAKGVGISLALKALLDSR